MENRLVSILVITYNSSKYIVEALDAAKNQLYDNIELIISDDCSKDDTVSICQKWLEKNGNRFVRTKIITVQSNTGICANLNRGFYECKGVWIKPIAGDDILLPNCIKDNMIYANLNEHAEIFLSEMIHFDCIYQTQNIINWTRYNKRIESFLEKDINEQLKVIVRSNFLPMPTMFVKNGFLDKFGLFYEKYYYEDWPMWITLIEKGVRILYLKKATVAYRHHASSLTANVAFLFDMHHLTGRLNIMRDMCYKYYSRRRIYVEELEYKIAQFFDSHKMNINSRGNRMLFRSIHKVLYFLKYDF